MGSKSQNFFLIFLKKLAFGQKKHLTEKVLGVKNDRKVVKIGLQSWGVDFDQSDIRVFTGMQTYVEKISIV